MQITITSIDETDSRPTVEFSCQHGPGRGRWATGAPRLGHEYDVELDFDQPIILGVNAKESKNTYPEVCVRNNQIVVIARIEDVFENDTACLRAGDSLILIDFEGMFPPVGSWLEISLPYIDLYDTNT